MATKTNPLAVMQGVVNAYQELGAPITANAVREARAAVAELVEADRCYDAAYEAWRWNPDRRDLYDAAVAAGDRRRAALAAFESQP